MTHISITHTNNFVAIITNPTEDVGIDIECLDRDFSAVEKKALSEDELDDLLDEKENDDERKKERTLQLAIYWCAKEALYKRMGRHAKFSYSGFYPVFELQVHYNDNEMDYKGKHSIRTSAIVYIPWQFNHGG